MSEACILCYFDHFINEQLWQKGLCGGLLSRSMLVRFQSAVPIDGELVKPSYDTSLLTRRGRKVARRSEACTLRQLMLNFITVTKCHTTWLNVSENLMLKNGALPNDGIGVSLQNSFNARSIRVGTSNDASDSSK